MKKLRWILLPLAALATLFAGGCATAPVSRQTGSNSYIGGAAPAPATTADSARASEPPRTERPGLGTGWGERRDSETVRTSFVRADGDRPAATDRVFYNDRQGVDAMVAFEGGSRRRVGGMARLSGGVALGLRDDSGNWLDGFSAGGRTFFVGDHGARYEIVVRNDTGDTREVVLSVDGLDVMDGRGASFAKRGYLVAPGETLTVDGFRTSVHSVAAFRFSSVSQSYAALRHGNTRNVGVIGIAVFAERRVYSRPPWDSESEKRHEANPFPGRRWAQPPE
jgi:hypothetical protein